MAEADGTPTREDYTKLCNNYFHTSLPLLKLNLKLPRRLLQSLHRVQHWHFKKNNTFRRKRQGSSHAMFVIVGQLQHGCAVPTHARRWSTLTGDSSRHQGCHSEFYDIPRFAIKNPKNQEWNPKIILLILELKYNVTLTFNSLYFIFFINFFNNICW